MSQEYKQVWRFYAVCPELLISDGDCNVAISLDEDESHMAAQVLRLKEGENIEIADGFGWTARAKITAVRKKVVEASIYESRHFARSSGRRIAIVGLPKPGALDEVIQCCVEAGVEILIVFKGDRSTSKQELKSEKMCKQVRELTRITKSPFCTEIRLANSLKAGLALLHSEFPKTRVFVCDERPAHLSEVAHKTPHLLTEALNSEMRDFAFIVGPESSFSQGEYEVLAGEESARRGQFVTLGPRILRTPAAVAAAAYLISGCVEGHQ